MKNQDLSVLKALLLREMKEGSMCNECGGPMYEGMCTECGYMEESFDKEELVVRGKTVKNYKQNGDTSYTVTYEDGSKDTIYVNNDDWDIINADAKKVNEKKLSKKQQYIAKQTPPEDKINAADFKKLRGMKKEDHEGTDHEVSMANNSLDSILWAANELKKYLGDQERDIPAWIQDHITNAENYIVQAAKNFHEYGQEEAEEGELTPNEMSLQEMIKKVGGKYNVYSKKGKKLGSHPSKKKAQKQMAAIEISKQGK